LINNEVGGRQRKKSPSESYRKWLLISRCSIELGLYSSKIINDGFSISFVWYVILQDFNLDKRKSWLGSWIWLARVRTNECNSDNCNDNIQNLILILLKY